MKSVFDNVTVRVGECGEFVLEDGRYLYIKGINQKEPVELFIDAGDELSIEQQTDVIETLQCVTLKMREMIRRISGLSEITHYDNGENVTIEPKKTRQQIQQVFHIIQVKQAQPEVIPRLLS